MKSLGKPEFIQGAPLVTMLLNRKSNIQEGSIIDMNMQRARWSLHRNYVDLKVETSWRIRRYYEKII